MIVILSPRQLGHVESVCDSTLMNGIFRDRGRQPSGMITINAPYICWWQIKDRLNDKIFTPTGARRADIPRSTVTALRKVATALNEYDRHPGFRGWAMQGLQRDLLHGWEMKEPDRFGKKFSPMPIAGRSFVALYPEWLTDSEMGFPVTVWSVEGAGPGEDWLAQEQAHLDFLR